MLTTLARVSLLTLVACAGAAHAGVDTIFSRANGASSIVPGALDAAGNPAVSHFQSLNEFFLSPDGSTWIMRATDNQPTSENQFLVRGNGLTGSVFLQKAQPFPGAPAGEVVNFPLVMTGYPFNANNDFAFGIRVTGNAQSFFCRILRYTGGVGASLYQTDDAYTGAVDGVTIGTSLNSMHLLNSGVIGWRDSTSGASSHMPIDVYNAARFVQSNVDTVMALDGSGPVGIGLLAADIGNFLTSPDGSVVLVHGRADVNGNHFPDAGDPDVIVLNSHIVAQAGQPLPGAPSITPTTIDEVTIAPNNDWYMRGTYSGGAWATRNGALIAKSGDAVGSNTWAMPFTLSGNTQNSFFAVRGNIRGDWVIVGRSTANVDTDDVVVVNSQVVLREGDPVPVDLDNDGVLDSAQVGRGPTSGSPAFVLSGNTPVGLAPDKTVYILANLRTVFGVDVSPFANSPGNALLRITPSVAFCCRNDFNGDGDVGTDSDIADFFACLGGNCCPTCPPNADFNCDGDTGTDSDIESFFRVLGGGSC
jgi:hypothetical protein